MAQLYSKSPVPRLLAEGTQPGAMSLLRAVILSKGMTEDDARSVGMGVLEMRGIDASRWYEMNKAALMIAWAKPAKEYLGEKVDIASTISRPIERTSRSDDLRDGDNDSKR